jgi:putative transposase
VSRGALFDFIAAQKTTYGVRRLSRVLAVSKTAFYDWAARGGAPTAAELVEAYAMHAAHQAWDEHRRVHGARRLTAQIRSRGHAWNRKRVARLMRVAGIEGIHRRRRGKYGRRTASTATADDLVERNFTARVPDQLWVADITVSPIAQRSRFRRWIRRETATWRFRSSRAGPAGRLCRPGPSRSC